MGELRGLAAGLCGSEDITVSGAGTAAFLPTAAGARSAEEEDEVVVAALGVGARRLGIPRLCWDGTGSVSDSMPNAALARTERGSCDGFTCGGEGAAAVATGRRAVLALTSSSPCLPLPPLLAASSFLMTSCCSMAKRSDA